MWTSSVNTMLNKQHISVTIQRQTGELISFFVAFQPLQLNKLQQDPNPLPVFIHAKSVSGFYTALYFLQMSIIIGKGYIDRTNS